MAVRTSQAEVSAVIADYDAALWSSTFISIASRVVDRVVDKNTDTTLVDSDFKDVETFLAAHFYSLKDPQAQRKQVGKSSATYQGITGKKLELTWYGQTALALDPTGLLESIYNAPPMAVGTHLTSY